MGLVTFIECWEVLADISTMENVACLVPHGEKDA